MSGVSASIGTTDGSQVSSGIECWALSFWGSALLIRMAGRCRAPVGHIVVAVHP